MTYTYIEEEEAEQQFRDELDELHHIVIGSMEFLASEVLEELDPTAYRCGFTDWLDSNELTISKENTNA
jgi:hypothetical protein